MARLPENSVPPKKRPPHSVAKRPARGSWSDVLAQPDASARKGRPGEVVRLPRRIIDAVLRAGSDDRALVCEVHARAVYVESIQCPGVAWYVRFRDAFTGNCGKRGEHLSIGRRMIGPEGE